MLVETARARDNCAVLREVRDPTYSVGGRCSDAARRSFHRYKPLSVLAASPLLVGVPGRFAAYRERLRVTGVLLETGSNAVVLLWVSVSGTSHSPTIVPSRHRSGSVPASLTHPRELSPRLAFASRNDHMQLATELMTFLIFPPSVDQTASPAAATRVITSAYSAMLCPDRGQLKRVQSRYTRSM
jgi:hypothetical protein